jgi:hypothetical protein
MKLTGIHFTLAVVFIGFVGKAIQDYFKTKQENLDLRRRLGRD